MRTDIDIIYNLFGRPNVDKFLYSLAKHSIYAIKCYIKERKRFNYDKTKKEKKKKVKIA